MQTDEAKRNSERISLVLEEFEHDSDDLIIVPAQMTTSSSLLEGEIEVERRSWCKIFIVLSGLILSVGVIGLVVFLSNRSNTRNLGIEASETLLDLPVEAAAAADIPVPCTEKVMLICMSAERIGDDLFFDAADEETFECLQNVSLKKSCKRFLEEIQRKEDIFYDAVGEAFAAPTNGEPDNREDNGNQNPQYVRKKIGKFFRGAIEYGKENKKARFCLDCSIGQISKWVFQNVFLPNLKLAGLFTDQLAMQTLEKQFIDLSVKHEDRLNLKEHLKKLPENLITTAIVLLYLPTLLILFPGFTAVGTIPLVGKAITLNSTTALFPIFVRHMVKLPENIWAFVRRSPEIKPSLKLFKSETKMFSSGLNESDFRQ